MNSEDVIKLIEQHGDLYTSRIIFDQLREFQPKADEMRKFYNRYCGKKPIQNRSIPDKAGIALDNKISNDFDGLIVDEIVGYLLGHPITRTYDDNSKGQKAKIEEEINNFEALNNIEGLDEETGEYASACGYGCRVLYYDKDGKLRAMNSKPWETIFITSQSTDETQFALIYYPWEIIDVKSGRIVKTIKVEWYDEKDVSYWIKEGGKYIRETSDEIDYQNPQPHNFEFVPVIKYRGNNLEQSDLYKVQSLIDAYDELISDNQNEIQEFVHAYLKTTGASIDEEERMKARKARVFNLPDKDADVGFITKNINDEFVEHQKETLNKNIFKFSKTVDMNDEKFTTGGAESGEARKWKLLGLEFKAVKKERKFVEAERNMFKVIGSAWNKKGWNFDYLKMNFIFVRSLPIDYLYYAEIATSFTGTLAKIDILSLMPFVKDPEKYLERLEKENDVDLDNIPSEEDLSARIKAIINNGN